MLCPCQSNLEYEKCCGPYLSGEAIAPTAEKLMRARYTAYTRSQVEYVKKTLAPESMKGFTLADAKKWADEMDWRGLKIIKTEKGQPHDSKGMVEFVATYANKEGEVLEHHEVSQFRKNEKGEWLFVDGDAHTHKEGEGHHHHPKPQTVVRESPKVGRNDHCPCGSGKKYKKCCGSAS